MKKSKIFFLYLNTGGGHLAPAQSINDYLISCKEGEVKTFLIDGLKEASFFVRGIIEKGYRQGITTAVWVYELWYLILYSKPLLKLTLFLISIHVKPYLKRRILKEQPNKIVIFHSFLIEPVYQVLKEERLDIKVIILVTDPYTAHPAWFQRQNFSFIVYSSEVGQRFLTGKDVCRFPVVLNKNYYSKAFHTAEDIKTKYGFNPKKDLVLFLGGGDGLPKGEQLLKKIIKTKPDYEIAFVCGRNRSLYRKIVRLKEKYELENLQVYGFIDFLYELSSASKVAITKAGASTIMELLITETVPIISRYIWGQEKGNVSFILKNNLGYYEKRISGIPVIIDSLLKNDREYHKMLSHIRAMGIKNGRDQVAEYIFSL